MEQPLAAPQPLAKQRPRKTGNGKRKTLPAYILLEMIIALAIFAIAVLGLAKALNNSLQAANMLNREAAVMLAMRSFMEEVRRKPLSDMAMTQQDERLGITLTSEITPEEVKTVKGDVVEDLYRLKVSASYLNQGKEVEDGISVFVYQTQEEQQKRKQR